jgi:hypothetical protein
MSVASLRTLTQPNPAFTNCSSKETIWDFLYCRRVCIEHDLAKGLKIRTNAGREVSVGGI